MKFFRLALSLSVFCLLTLSAHAQNNQLFAPQSSPLNTPSQPLSDQDVAAMAGNKYASGELPLGDNRVVTTGPQKGYIYLCHKPDTDMRPGAQNVGNWIHGNTWNINQKISVQGAVKWDEAYFDTSVQGNVRLIAGNGLPIGHTTGTFPVSPLDPAAAVDRNPNTITETAIRQVLPANPAYSNQPYCMGMEVGYMLDGVPLFNGFDAGLRDAAAHEVQDSCQGHPDPSGLYHYHSLSSCIQDTSVKTVIGYALDGFPITGPNVAPGKYLTTDNLDDCHGITSEIIVDGQKKMTYHYVMTMDFPYSASCFRAQPVQTGPLQPMAGVNSGQGSLAGMGPRPPARAIAACRQKSDGDSCSFMSPGGMIRGTCDVPPQQRVLACVP